MQASSPMQQSELRLVFHKLLHPQQGASAGSLPLLPGLPPLPLEAPALEGLAALAAELDVEPVVAMQACFLDGPCCLEHRQSVQRDQMLRAMQLLPVRGGRLLPLQGHGRVALVPRVHDIKLCSTMQAAQARWTNGLRMLLYYRSTHTHAFVYRELLPPCEVCC
jgi:hypothetical protein